MEIVRADRVVKRQGHQFTLGPIDLAVRPGEVLGIIGGRNSGKTTLMKLIWGFLKPDQGKLSVFEQQPHLNQVSVRRQTGYLSELPSLNACMTARRHLQFISNFYDGWNPSTVDQLLDRFRIDPGTRVQELSESARIKLALISAAGHDPCLLLLDDPMSRLDEASQNEISEFLKALACERGIGVVVSARRSTELSGWADSMLALIDGKIQEWHRG